jgi:hypothetical protein
VPQPSSAARSTPAASITARTSSIRVSRSGGLANRSDIPVPRLSKTNTRIWRDSRFIKRAYLGCSQYTSKCEIQPWMTTSVIRPSPKSWYAIYAPSTALAQRVFGITRPSCCATSSWSRSAQPDGRTRPRMGQSSGMTPKRSPPRASAFESDPSAGLEWAVPGARRIAWPSYSFIRDLT